MASPFTPQFGARFLLERKSVDELTAQYEVSIFTPEVQHRGQLLIRQHDGVCQIANLVSTPESAPPLAGWVEQHLQALGRQEGRLVAASPEALARRPRGEVVASANARASGLVLKLSQLGRRTRRRDVAKHPSEEEGVRDAEALMAVSVSRGAD